MMKTVLCHSMRKWRVLAKLVIIIYLQEINNRSHILTCFIAICIEILMG